MSDQEVAQNFVSQCKEYGFTYTVGTNILRVHRKFQPGNLEEFTYCDMWGPHLLGIVKATQPGSIWGTDGGSVGGHVAVTSGNYTLNKSGCSKRILKQISKI